MNILVITQYFWPESFRINDLVLELKSKGHEVTVFTGLPNYPDGKIYAGYKNLGWRKESYKNINIQRVPIFPRGSSSRIRLILNYASFVLFSCVSAPFCLKDNYDVIFVFEPSPITVCFPAILVKKLRNIPIILWVQDLWPESLSATGAVKSSILLYLVGCLVKYIYRKCDLILVQSRAFIQSVKKFGIDANIIHYFPNSAEKLYKPVYKKDTNEIIRLPAGFKVIFAGNIGVAQAIETILDAAVLLKSNIEIQWVIIGDGRMKSWLQKEINIRQLQKTVHTIDNRPIEEMPYYFSEADILLATLKQDPIFSLTVPSKIQSYLASGKPIVAAIDGETAKVIKDSGSGISVPAESPQELSAAILKLYKMTEEERDKMGLCGRLYFEKNFDSAKLVTQLEGWMLDLAGS